MAIFNKTFLFLLLACYGATGVASELKDSGAQKAASVVSEPAEQEKKVFFLFEDGEKRLIPSFIYNQMRGIKDLVDFNSENIYEDQTVIDIPVKNISKRAFIFIMELINTIESDEDFTGTYTTKIINKYFVKQFEVEVKGDNLDAVNFLYEIYHLIDFLDLRLIDTTKGDTQLLNIITKTAVHYLLKIDNFVDLDTLPFNTNYSFTKELRWLLVPHLKECSPLLVTQSHDAVIVTRIADGQQMLSLRCGEVGGHQELIVSARLSSDNSLLVTKSYDAFIVTRIADGEQMLSLRCGEVGGHQEPIVSARLSSDNSLLVTKSYDAVIVTHIADGQQMLSVRRGEENGHQEDIYSAQLSSDNSLLVTQSHDAVIVTHIADGQPMLSVRRGEVGGHQEILWSAQLSSDNSFLTTRSRDAVIVTHIADGQQMLSVRRGEENGHQEDIYSAQLSSDNSLLVTQSHDAVIVTHIADGQQMLSLRRGEENGHQERIGSAQFVQNISFRLLIIGSDLSLDQICEVISGQKNHKLSPFIELFQINVITPEGKLLSEESETIPLFSEEDRELNEVLESALLLFDKEYTFKKKK